VLPNRAAPKGIGAFRPDSSAEHHPSPSARSKRRGWRVLHACEYARDVLPVVEGQVNAGMQPYIVTPKGAGAAELYLANKDLEQPETLSLLRAWQDVRNWRKSLLECDPESTADLVHTHSFASGMAGVRNLPCVVYDLRACIEDLAIAAGQCEPGSWMGRSFRVAEQFVLARAKTVIVHSPGMKAAVMERGAALENVFVIPDPLPFEQEIAFRNSDLRERFGIKSTATVYLLLQADAAVTVLEALVAASAQAQDGCLLLQAEPEGIVGRAQKLGIADRVFCIQEAEASAAMEQADVVIAPSAAPDNLLQGQQSASVSLKALSLGKALLAADVALNRDASPDGRGCLWFRDGDVRDLGQRMAFLASHPEFRAALGAAGRAYIAGTRSSAALGGQYDAAYRHAIKQKRASGPGPKLPGLLPVTSAV